MNCKICKKEIPEDAIFCCYCGKKQISTPRKQKGRGNGQGSVYQLPNGKWRAVVTLGYVDGKRKTKSKTFSKKSDAVMFIPDLKEELVYTPQITFKEALDKMMEQHEQNVSAHTYKQYKTDMKKLAPLYPMKLVDIKLEHIQKVFDSCSYGYGTKNIMRALTSLVYQYAIKNDIVEKDYSKYLSIGKNDLKSREAFTMDEIKLIKEHADKGTEFADYIMVLIFTGFRISELFALKKEDYYDGCLHGGSKTETGKNRIVPVSPIIQPYIDKRMEHWSEYLFPSPRGYQMVSTTFSSTYFPNALKEMGITRKLVPHSCRHTFATLCNKTNSNDFVARKRLIGHTDLQTTARYTHSDVEDMRALINELSID